MNKWEVSLFQWVLERFCPKPPKPPKHRLEVDWGPMQTKYPSIQKES